jgi:hypothetical protein
MSLTDFNAKMNKSKIDKYQIKNNNKTNTKHEFNVKYERYKQDISKDRKLFHGRDPEKNEIVEESYHTPILC